MKSLFHGYIRPTQEEFAELWRHSIFIFDTNSLLNVYRYSEETSEQFLILLEKLADRVWIPHQVGLEFFRHRVGVIFEQQVAYGTTQNDLKRILDDFNVSRKHPFLSKQKLERLEALVHEINEELSASQEKHRRLIQEDPLQDRILQLFDGKTGVAYSSERLSEIYKEGERRYKDKTPPGYMDDKDKSESHRKYGDLVLWYELIDTAKEVNKPVILVSDDVKEDWWWKEKGFTIGPKPELVHEMRAKANVMFYMYQPSRFMEQAVKFLNEKIDKAAINEAKEVEKARAEAMTLMSAWAAESELEKKVFERWLGRFRDLKLSPEEKKELSHDKIRMLKAFIDSIQNLWYHSKAVGDFAKTKQQLVTIGGAILQLIEEKHIPSHDILRAICDEITIVTNQEWNSKGDPAAFMQKGDEIMNRIARFADIISFFKSE
jgi:hypothetical protein